MSDYWQGFCTGLALASVIMYLLLRKSDDEDGA